MINSLLSIARDRQSQAFVLEYLNNSAWNQGTGPYSIPQGGRLE